MAKRITKDGQRARSAGKTRTVRRGATRTRAAATTRGRIPRSTRSRPAVSTRTEIDNSIPVKLTPARRKELLQKLKESRPKNLPLGEPESPTAVLARLRANEPKPALSKRNPGAVLDSTYPERRAAWEKAVAREQERERALKAGGVTAEENQRMAASSEHLVKRLGATQGASGESKSKGTSTRTRTSSPRSRR